MLDAETLFKLTSKPRIDQISLKLLQQYYEQYLEPYIFIFRLDNGETIHLEFHKKHLCHLLGIERIAKGSVKSKDLHKYSGIEGFRNIQNGIITKEHLKRLNKGKFNSAKDKLIFFYLLPSIIDSPQILLDFVARDVHSLIQAKLLAYVSTEQAYVHLGIDQDHINMRFFPRTYLIERITQTSDGTKFIKDQSPLKVVKTDKVNKKHSLTLS
ncbi:PBECR4 domain-containing protein [Paenibacillus turicensis]|uniref:PBECR4 domain-containing protein n=1 Tax=Paenibacillus turicensis TaxID=160487 RepID=UPI003D28B2D0